MGRIQKEWARKQRALLKHLLGNRCADCKKQSEDLEFDCISPCGDDHHKLDTSARMSFYRHQYRLFNLQLLCPSCHAKKTKLDRESDPF
jgi:5-methylcytosine-specific restriction endonuclease McrA